VPAGAKIERKKTISSPSKKKVLSKQSRHKNQLEKKCVI